MQPDSPHDMTVLVVLPIRVVPGRTDVTSVAEAIADVADRYRGALLARGVSVGEPTVSVVPIRADLIADAAKRITT